MFGKYGKAIGGLLITLIVFAILARSSTANSLFWNLSAVELAESLGVAAAAVTLYFVPLFPRAPQLKSTAFFLTMLAPILMGLLNDGWSEADLSVLLIEVAGLLGIPLAPARSDNGTAVGWGSDRVIEGRLVQ